MSTREKETEYQPKLSDNRGKVFGVEKVSPLFLGGERDWSIDVMRCFSCFLVCAIHATNLGRVYDHSIPGDNAWLHHEFYRMLFASPTVLFVMVSGIFFLSPERNVRISKVWKKNVAKLAGAYIFWCFIYALYSIHKMDPQPEITWKLLFDEWMVHPAHFWYIPMMIGLYIICPILRPITASGDTKLYVYIVAVFIGGMILWTINYWPPETDEFTTREAILAKTPVFTICQYSFWMLFGWIAYTYRPKRAFRYLIYLAGIISIIVGTYFNAQNWMEFGDYNMTAVTQKFGILQFIKNTATFYFVVTVFRNHEFSKIGKFFLRKWSDCTLIIYLVHFLVMHLLYDFEFLYSFFEISPWVAVWIYAIVAYILSGLIGVVFHMFWDPIHRAIKASHKRKERKKKRALRRAQRQQTTGPEDTSS